MDCGWECGSLNRGARWRWSVAHLGQICSISGYIFFFAGQALHTSGTIAVDCDGAIALGGNVAGCFEGSGASWLVPRHCTSAALLIIFGLMHVVSVL